SGVDPLAVQDIQGIITGLKNRGMGILITDHNVRETLAVVDRAYLLFEGRILREGESSFLTNDRVSRELYLGDEFRM
ncbi:MAG: lipopolysaccharide ABC transporter ATP-binding protein, partial [Lentisphaerae bacterium]|nr:lipopolysaccharide ABC transporter ATP-binding protein [Lentisphaerota bacterium]